MLIAEVAVGTIDVAAVADFHRDVLHLPILHVGETTVEVGVGAGVVRYEQRPPFAGVHHLAFGLAPEDFDRAHAFLAERVEILPAAGSEVIEGPEGWHSRSVYFNGPDGLVLEYIGHEAHRGRGASSPAPSLLGIAEVGIGVPHVSQVVQHLLSLGLNPFPPQEDVFAPVGDPNGMLILVQQARRWFPQRRHRAATDTVTITLDGTGAGISTRSIPGAIINTR